eukprot:11805705-Alexandrium_andersonii.AAC.1
MCIRDRGGTRSPTQRSANDRSSWEPRSHEWPSNSRAGNGRRERGDAGAPEPPRGQRSTGATERRR